MIELPLIEGWDVERMTKRTHTGVFSFDLFPVFFGT
jgi:hypothetical protein